MSKWLGIICIAACFGIGCGDDDGTTGTDSGPIGMDAGPGGDDAGPGGDDAGPGGDDAGPGGDDAGPGGDDAGPGMCMTDYDGTYDVMAVDPSAVCAMITIDTCTMVTVDGVSTVTCGPAMADCTFDANCVCTAMTMITDPLPADVVIVADFPNGTVSASVPALMTECNFTIALQE